ncbi:MAG: DUF1007 family protein [Campylobacterales bacterium]|nr:DUF1007 family protein [Campylobacterales bacterium]
MILRSLFIFLLAYSFLFSCTICTLQTPKVDVYIDVFQQKEKTEFQISWEFDEGFTQETLIPFDKNKNQYFEPEELDGVNKSIVDYIKDDSYITFIKEAQKEQDFEKASIIPLEISYPRVVYQNKKMYFKYIATGKYNIKKDTGLEIKIFDKGLYFDYTIRKVNFTNTIKPEVFNIEFETARSYFYNYIPKIKPQNVQKPIPTQKKQNVVPLPEKKVEKQPEDLTILGYVGKVLDKIKERMTVILTDIKENNSITSYLWLLFFSFFYGIIHAIGPGHGKSLVSAYFLTSDKSYFKAFNISLLIAVVHTFSAFLLTFVIYYILNTYLSKYFTDIEEVATKVSALVIIGIAVYLIYKKFIQQPKKIKPSSFTKAEKNSEFTLQPIQNHSHSCGCGSCQTTSTDLGVILSAGIVPCPGTITIFIFTMSLGIYTVGFISALFMSLGMSFIIFFMSMISIKVRQTATQNTTVIMVLEYGSLMFILSLGIALLLI